MTTTPNISLRTRPRRHLRRALVLGGALLGVSALVAPGAGAQVTPGGGPFASGTVTTVSGTNVSLESEFQDDPVTVTLDEATTYQKIETVAVDSAVEGDCVRVSGSGDAKKGIKATTMSITEASDEDCDAAAAGPDGGGRGFPGGGGGGIPGGDGQTPPSLPEGATPPSGGGDGQGFPGGGGRGAGGTSAVGTVTSVSTSGVVVKGTIITIPSSQRSEPKIANNKKVKVSVSDKTDITTTVEGAVTDVVAGVCMTAGGTGDSSAISAESVVISEPQEDGTCSLGFGGGGGGFPGGGPSTAGG